MTREERKGQAKEKCRKCNGELIYFLIVRNGLCATVGLELTTPYSSRSPLPSSRVTKFPLGVRCRDRRPFFDLLLGSATGSLNTFTFSSQKRNKEV